MKDGRPRGLCLVQKSSKFQYGFLSRESGGTADAPDLGTDAPSFPRSRQGTWCGKLKDFPHIEVTLDHLDHVYIEPDIRFYYLD